MTDWRPTHDDPLFILAMDHRDSFGTTLFDVQDDDPTPEQKQHMSSAKQLIYDGLEQTTVSSGRRGVLVDEQYGQAVIDRAHNAADIVLAVPVEASGHDWFTLQWGDLWLEHVRRIGPDYAKILVRDNPDLPADRRTQQFTDLAAVSSALADAHVPLLYELLVPATDAQLASVGGDAERYDHDVRPDLVARVIADNQAHGVEPTMWKIEGLETVDAAQHVAAAARADGRDVDLIVLGRDAPVERLDHWLAVAAQVPSFVGFAIGRSIWQEPVGAWAKGELDGAATSDRVGASFAGFVAHWS